MCVSAELSGLQIYLFQGIGCEVRSPTQILYHQATNIKHLSIPRSKQARTLAAVAYTQSMSKEESTSRPPTHNAPEQEQYSNARHDTPTRLRR